MFEEDLNEIQYKDGNKKIQKMIGKIDQEGIMIIMKNSMGFTILKCILELIANSIDACAKNIKLCIEGYEFLFIDDGKGMDLDDLEKMFVMCGSSNERKHTLGTFGLGAKAALVKLSDEKNWKVITSKDGNNFYKADTTSVKMEGYEQQIPAGEANEEEKKKFKEYVPNGSGTIIILKHTDDLISCIDTQFDDPDKINIDEQIGTIFGRIDNIKISRIKGGYTEELKMYNPVIQDEYEIPIIEHKVKLYKRDNINRLILEKDDKNLEYIPNKIIENKTDNNEKEKTTYSKNIEEVDIKILENGNIVSVPKDKTKKKYTESEYKFYGDFKIITYMPKMPKSVEEITGGKIMSKYDEKFFKLNKNIYTYQEKIIVCRNGHIIGCKKRIKNSDSKRANKSANIKSSMIRSEIHINPICSHDNEFDKIIGVQANKNQLSENIDENLGRIIEHLRDDVYNKIIEEEKKKSSSNNSEDKTSESSSNSNKKTGKDVSSYRKGSVTGKEIKEILKKSMEKFNDNDDYNSEPLNMYNKFNKMLVLDNFNTFIVNK